MTTTLWVISISFLVIWIIGLGSQVGYFSFFNRQFRLTRRGIHLSPSNEKEQRGTTLDPLTSELFERHSMVQKSRGLLVRGLAFGFAAVLAMAMSFIMTTHFGAIYLIVGLILVVALIFAHMRSTVRYITSVICTTPCPRCGKFPMDHKARSKDERRLLICTQCRIEWDLGPAAL
jgi:hypothetical protein